MGAESHGAEEARPMNEEYFNIWRTVQLEAPVWTSSKTDHCPCGYQTWSQPYQFIQHWRDSLCNETANCHVDQAWHQRIVQVWNDGKWKQKARQKGLR